VHIGFKKSILAYYQQGLGILSITVRKPLFMRVRYWQVLTNTWQAAVKTWQVIAKAWHIDMAYWQNSNGILTTMV